MSGASSIDRCQILLELAEKIAVEDPQQRELRIVQEDGSDWQVLLSTPSGLQHEPPTFATLDEALEDFVLHWQRFWLPE